MDVELKAIVKLARNVKRARRLEQKAYNALINSNSKVTNSDDLANWHEMAMIATSITERNLSSLVIRLLVDKKRRITE